VQQAPESGGDGCSLEQDGEASRLNELTMQTRQQSSDPVATIGVDIGGRALAEPGREGHVFAF